MQFFMHQIVFNGIQENPVRLFKIPNYVSGVAPNIFNEEET